MVVTHILRNNNDYVSLLGEKFNLRLSYTAWNAFLKERGALSIPFEVSITKHHSPTESSIGSFVSINDARCIK